jgi:hypothetical protein
MYFEPNRHWHGEPNRSTWEKLIKKYCSKADMIEVGSRRVVFITSSFMDKWAYKIPLSGDANRDNEFEAGISRVQPFPVAECSIHERVSGITVLRMEIVTPIEWSVRYSEEFEAQYPWVADIGDGRQVGYTKKGAVVAFDLGHMRNDNGRNW